jgi:ABC-2 type transport system ATP-binding protein
MAASTLHTMISVHGLTKRYRSVAVVDGVSFTCGPGTITGFLGPNGAGKSTTLRMITGLARPDRGHATVAGRRFVDLPNPTRVVGTLLDASAMHAGRTGRETLRIAAAMAGIPARRVEQVLADVDLSGAAGRRVGTYSLGMRQRLGLAQALIGGPRVLILDEPANGLDPDGIVRIRELLRDFADRGGTVLLSSHMLAEVQATVDHLVVIRSGRVVARGSVAELLAAGGLLARATDPAALRRLLTAAAVPFRPDADADGAVRVATGGGVDAERIAGLAAAAGLPLVELRPAGGDLEELFFSLTGSGSTSAHSALSQEVTR